MNAEPLSEPDGSGAEKGDMPGEITRLLRQFDESGQNPISELMPLVYDELRRMAARCFRNELRELTLQPTALINEVYLRLVDSKRLHFEDRLQFYRFAGLLMRRILVDHARSRQTAKRGAEQRHVHLNEDIVIWAGDRALDLPTLIALDGALTRLAALDARQVQIVCMRFFAGLRIREVASVLQLSTTIITREWSMAKAWLAREMSR